MKYFKFKALLRESGWLTPAYIGVDNLGIIQYLSANNPSEPVSVEAISGFALPGFQNAHSHAFQYAMAGKAEKHVAGTSDDFWSWREAMYRVALSMTPDDVESVATMLYAEMLRKGYTHVAEFHYLHHDKNGRPYASLAEMGERLVSAAKNAGIKITLIPVLYQKSNFGKEALVQQKRFISQTVDDYLQLLADSASGIRTYADARLGFGVHSLRAVDHLAVIRTFEQGPQSIPFHLHVAEQLKEVEDCVRHLNFRPAEWLLDNLPVDDRFHMVHCTHLTDHEITALAQSKANVVLCPGTEGNLGDGIFKLSNFAQQKGSWCIGTDSHISLNMMEDLRWLDYSQRLTTHKRNTFDEGATALFHNAIFSGRKAMGLYFENFFAIGKPLDAVIFDSESAGINQTELHHLLSSILYTSDSSQIYGTIVNGKWVVRNKHRSHEQIFAQFSKTMKSLSNIS